MVLVVIITFAVSWLPLYIIFCVAKFYEQILEVAWVHETFYVLLPLAQWLGASNSCVNPLLYAYLNRRFRKHFLVSVTVGWRVVGGISTYVSLYMFTRRKPPIG